VTALKFETKTSMKCLSWLHVGFGMIGLASYNSCYSLHLWCEARPAL